MHHFARSQPGVGSRINKGRWSCGRACGEARDLPEVHVSVDSDALREVGEPVVPLPLSGVVSYSLEVVRALFFEVHAGNACSFQLQCVISAAPSPMQQRSSEEDSKDGDYLESGGG